MSCWLGAAGWPWVRHAARGARSWQVLDQLASLEGHRYAVGALTVGANDVLFDWDAERYDANLRAILEAMNASMRSGAGSDISARFPALSGLVAAASARPSSLPTSMIRAAATELGAAIVDGGDLRGQLLRPDRVHPSVRGQMVLADRAAAILGLDRRPSDDHRRVPATSTAVCGIWRRRHERPFANCSRG